jgi:hypothetical protein
MNLLSLIIVFLALVICGSIADIAWVVSEDRTPDWAQENDDTDEPPPADPAAGGE